MYSKADLFNLALGALLLSRQISDPDTDKSNEVRVLNTHWDSAFWSALQDMDLDGTSTEVKLQLIEDLTATDDNPLWHWTYKYPSDCSFFRRIKSCERTDNRDTHIPKRIGIRNSQKVIFTNQDSAVAEYISSAMNVGLLSAPAGLCVAYRLAWMSSPLIVGKGAKQLKEEIHQNYLIIKAEAQAHDQRENFVFDDPALSSEFVGARMS